MLRRAARVIVKARTGFSSDHAIVLSCGAARYRGLESRPRVTAPIRSRTFKTGR